ncbi:MAG: ABC transporter substrate-binding protein [Planctomycetes bacterium]|nr:ABC transporter substrate-binding protein [Planctomycetota bacterium]
MLRNTTPKPKTRLLRAFAAILVCASLGSNRIAAFAQAKDPILVGHYASTSGAEATFGKSTDNGILMAVAERNAAGGVKGRPLQVITYDDQGKQSEAATVVTRLITKDKVVALLGEVASSRSLAGGRLAQRYGIPMVTPSSTNPEVTKIGDMIFRVCFIDPFQGEVCAKFAMQRGWKKAAVLYDKTQAYSTGLNTNFTESYPKLGGTIVARETYGGGDSDFGAQLTNIRAAAPDVIFIPGYYSDVGNIAIQARKLGLAMPLLGTDGWDSSKLAETAGNVLEGCCFSNHYSHEEARPAVKDFVEKYKARFGGETPDGLAALGYDAALVLFAAMDRAPSLAGRDIAKELAATKEFAGVTGTITIDSGRNANKSAVMLEFKQGQWRYAATIEPDGK